MIDQVDTSVGKLVGELKANKKLDNTLIFVLSDNGGSALAHPNGLIGSTGAPWTRMRYVPIHTRDKRVVISGDVVGVKPGPEDTYGGCGMAWANLSNAPFRMFKKFSHEGGVATPLIMHWPQVLTKKGTIVHEVAHVIDFFPTILDAAGTKHLKKIHGKKSLSLDGLSLLPLAREGTPLARKSIGFEHAGNRGLRMGGWKLVAENGKEWELYHLAKDRCETKDLAASNPEKLQELLSEYEQWAAKSWVKDWTIVSASLQGKQAGTVVLPSKDNPLCRTQEEIDASVKAINKVRAKRKLPALIDLSK